MVTTTRTLAIIMRRWDFRESSRIVQLCTRDFGRLAFVAKGAHRAKSPFLGAIDLLHVCEARVRVRASRGLQELYGLKVLQDNRAFRSSELRRWLAYRWTEVVRLALPEGRIDPELFDLYRGALSLCALAAEPCLPTVEAGLRLRMLSVLGVLADLETCPQSGRSLPSRGRVAFSPGEGGFLHPSAGGRRVSARLPPLARQLLGLEGRILGTSRAPTEDLTALLPLLDELLVWHLGETPRLASPDNLLAAAGRQHTIVT